MGHVAQNWQMTDMMISDGLCRMKFIAAYLLAVLAGNSSPSAEDLTAILESGNFSLLPFQ
jgi:hypothetical protein